MKFNIILSALCFIFFSSCSTKKLVSKLNTLYQVKQYMPPAGGSYAYDIVKVIPERNFKATILEVGNNLIIVPVTTFSSTTSNRNISQDSAQTYFALINKYYYPETNYFLDSSQKRFIYYDIKFGLQALTIPMKFRHGIGSDSLNPPNIETAVNIGFAPVWKFQKNIYKPIKNYLGSNTSQISVAIGPFGNLSTADLNKESNAPGLLSNRKRPVLSFGGFCLFGFNNINIGYAVGFDNVLGTGKINWVYQGKLWQGVIISLDVLKF